MAGLITAIFITILAINLCVNRIHILNLDDEVKAINGKHVKPKI